MSAKYKTFEEWLDDHPIYRSEYAEPYCRAIWESATEAAMEKFKSTTSMSNSSQSNIINKIVRCRHNDPCQYGKKKICPLELGDCSDQRTTLPVA